jgi:hypothetical protein
MNDNVIYKDIDNFPGYKVGNDGSVWSCRYSDKSWKRLKTDSIKRGYLRVTLQPGRNHRLVHRLVLEQFIGPCPKTMEACHNDGNVTNNQLSNLRWDTRINNTNDKRKHGRIPYGEKSGCAKLTSKQVLKIRNMYENGYAINEISEYFDATQQNIYSIVHYKTWKHIENPPKTDGHGDGDFDE